MPSAKTKSALSRQWDLLKLLPRTSPGYTVADLHKRLINGGHEITRRTVERDLLDLSFAFNLHSEESTTPRGWFLPRGADLALSGISLPEAVSLRLVEDAVRPLLPASMLSILDSPFNLARSKLEGVEDGSPGARWPEKVASVRSDFNLLPPQINARTLETIQQALITEKQLRCRYYSAHSDKSSELTLNPLAIVQRGQITYLIATAEGYSDIRQYAAHRFQDIEELQVSCEGVQQFKLQDYLATDALQFGTPTKIRFKAWISARQARLIRETPLSQDMELQAQEDGFLVQATVSDTWQLQWWVLSQGDDLVVHEPVELRQRVQNTLRRALRAYDDNHSHQAAQQTEATTDNQGK